MQRLMTIRCTKDSQKLMHAHLIDDGLALQVPDLDA